MPVENMKEALRPVLVGAGCIVYFGMGLVQLAAVFGGIQFWWGWPWWAAGLLGLPIAFTPILGTVVGIMGAIRAWGWSPMFTILLFCWPYVLYVGAILVVGFPTIFYTLGKRLFRGRRE